MSGLEILWDSCGVYPINHTIEAFQFMAESSFFRVAFFNTKLKVIYEMQMVAIGLCLVPSGCSAPKGKR